MIFGTKHSTSFKIIAALICLFLFSLKGAQASNISIKPTQPVRLCVTYVNNQLIVFVNDIEVYNKNFLVDVEKENPRDDCIDLSNTLKKGENIIKVMGYNHTAFGLDDMWHFGYNINIDGDVDPEFSFEEENPAGKGNLGKVYEKIFVLERE